MLGVNKDDIEVKVISEGSMLKKAVVEIYTFASPEEREEYKIRPMDLGNLFHKALETFSKKVKESDYSWKTIPEKVQNEYISEALQTAMDENLGDVFYSSSRNR